MLSFSFVSAVCYILPARTMTQAINQLRTKAEELMDSMLRDWRLLGSAKSDEERLAIRTRIRQSGHELDSVMRQIEGSRCGS